MLEPRGTEEICCPVASFPIVSKVKLSLFLKYYAMKTYEGMDV
jgi:hypothetical protein